MHDVCDVLAAAAVVRTAVLMSSPRLRARRPLAALVAAVCGVRGPCGTTAAAAATASTIQSAAQGATVAGRGGTAVSIHRSWRRCRRGVVRLRRPRRRQTIAGDGRGLRTRARSRTMQQQRPFRTFRVAQRQRQSLTVRCRHAAVRLLLAVTEIRSTPFSTVRCTST